MPNLNVSAGQVDEAVGRSRVSLDEALAETDLNMEQ